MLDDPMELDPSLRQSRTPGLPTGRAGLLNQGYGARDIARAHIQAGGGVLNSSLRHGTIPVLETTDEHVLVNGEFLKVLKQVSILVEWVVCIYN